MEYCGHCMPTATIDTSTQFALELSLGQTSRSPCRACTLHRRTMQVDREHFAVFFFSTEFVFKVR